MKKLLVLGGDHFTIPVVEAAHKQGYYVITCDYLPDNVAHKLSDEYINYSTTDKEGILEAARNLNIDGIVTFTDSGVVTCAYVANKLGLHPTGPIESVEILQDKAKFRNFLEVHGFNVPRSKGYTSYDEAKYDIDKYNWPIIVKPVDSAASKGVTRVDDPANLKGAIEYALLFSAKKKIIIEEFIEKEGCSSDSDCFTVDGQFKVLTYSAQRFDESAANVYAPSGFTWPSTYTKEQEEYLSSELQRLVSLLGMKTTIYNIESRLGTDGKMYIMEVSPRGGGNRLAEMVRFSTGADMITAAVRAAVGDTVEITQSNLKGHWAELILHSETNGIFEELVIDNDYYNKYVFQVDLWIRKGDKVEEFSGGNKAIGTLVLHFHSTIEMENAIRNPKQWIHVKTK